MGEAGDLAVGEDGSLIEPDPALPPPVTESGVAETDPPPEAEAPPPAPETATPAEAAQPAPGGPAVLPAGTGDSEASPGTEGADLVRDVLQGSDPAADAAPADWQPAETPVDTRPRQRPPETP